MFFRETIRRGVAPIGRAPDSKSGCWEFESLHPCHHLKPRYESIGAFYYKYTILTFEYNLVGSALYS